MTNSITKIGFLLLLISTLISCSSKTKIEINFDSSQKGILVFDNQDTVKIVGDSVLVYEINSGVHKFKIGRAHV